MSTLRTPADAWTTCGECAALGRVHVTRSELEADPIGAWRQLWRGNEIAVRWHDHPCDARYDPASSGEQYWPKAWAVFGPWGVDEAGHVAMQESERITSAQAVEFLSHQDPAIPHAAEAPMTTAGDILRTGKRGSLHERRGA